MDRVGDGDGQSGERGRGDVKPAYRPSEVAVLVGLSIESIYRLIQDRLLVAMNVARRRDSKRPTYRIHREDLVEFLKERGMTDSRIRQLLS